MPIYRITFPNRTPVDVQGVSIRTEIVTTTVPPSLPNYFTFRGTVVTNTGALVDSQVGGLMFSYTFPTLDITYAYQYLGNPYCHVVAYGTNPPGTQGSLWVTQYSVVICGSAYITPGNTTVSRCDVLVTTATGNVLRLQGTNGQPCPTWVATPDNECRPDEIKCTDLSDPRGFCCISCDALNTKIRVLI